MPPSPATIKLDTAKFNRAVTTFLRGKAPGMVDKAVRKIAFDVTHTLVVSLNGGPETYAWVPRRIDTGRYRAAWVTGTRRALGVNVGPADINDPEGKNPVKAGDGTGSRTGRGLTRQITVTNAVEYAQDVELGTVNMTAGLHLYYAVRKVGKGVAGMVGGAMKRAWQDRPWDGR